MSPTFDCSCRNAQYLVGSSNGHREMVFEDVSVIILLIRNVIEHFDSFYYHCGL